MKRHVKRLAAVVLANAGLISLLGANDETLATLVIPFAAGVALLYAAGALLKGDKLEDYE